jgi:hypothetical protein
MELKKFIKTVLVDICSAVEESKNLTKTSIAPSRLFFGNEQLTCKDPQFIEFDIGLDVKDSKTKSSSLSGKAEVFVMNSKAGIHKQTSEEKNSTHRIKFSVPVYFQAQSAPTKK